MRTKTRAKPSERTAVKPASRNAVLLTGGAGYIGSHTVVALLGAGYMPVVLDDFSNSRPEVLERLKRLTGQTIICERGNALDAAFTESVLRRHDCAAAIHLAGFKAVGESVAQPLKYFHNNVGSLVSLLHAMTAWRPFTWPASKPLAKVWRSR